MSNVFELAEGETVLLTVRRHWFRVVIEGIIYSVLFLALVMVIGAGETLLHLTASLRSMNGPFALGLYIVGLVGLLLWMRFFSVWSDHWLDVWLITDRRIIDIEHRGFFSRQVSSFPLERIQDVTYTVQGVIPTWLHFGDVRIQTASITDDLIMRQVPFPEIVKENILESLTHREDGLLHR